MTLASSLARLLRRATFVQAARAAEVSARGGQHAAGVGHDGHPSEEAVRFVASDRLMLVPGAIAEIEERDGQTVITANVLGLAGATPALPMVYSELQLRRRRLRDFGFARFLNLFDHRALSFFYRIVRKFSWPLLAEGRGRAEADPVARLLTALAGVGTPGVINRLDLTDQALIPLIAHLADVRRSAASVQAVLRSLSGLPLRVIEAQPVWMALPLAEQSRLGGLGSQAAQLGSGNVALIGATVLDVQHHFIVELGPLTYQQLQAFCSGQAARRILSQLCWLAAGLEQCPSLRLVLHSDDIPPLRLGHEDAPALLGWTSWLGAPLTQGFVRDCVIPLDTAAMA